MSPDGTTVAVGGFIGPENSVDTPIYIFDRESGALRRAIHGLPEVAHHLAYSKDGRYLAVALHGTNGIRVFATANYSEVTRDATYGDSPYWIEFDNSGRLLTTGDDGFVRLYSSDFRLLHKEKPRSGKGPRSARFSPDGKLIVVGFNDLAALDVLSGQDLGFQYKVQTPPDGYNLAAALWSADGGTLCATGRRSGEVDSVLCWSDAGKGKQQSFPAAGDTILDIRALRGGAIAFCSSDGTVGVLDRNGIAKWGTPDELEYRGEPAFPRLSPDGNDIELASSYFNGITSSHHNIAFSVSGQSLETDAQPKPSLLSPTTSGLAINGWRNGTNPTLDGHSIELQEGEEARSLAISSGNDGFVLGSEFFIRRFDPRGKLIWSIPLQGVGWGVNITADKRFVVATLGDGTVRWYTFDKGEEVLALFVDHNLQRWVAWNPDGFFTFHGGGDALIGYHMNRGPDQAGEFVKVDQLRETFYRPDLVAEILKPGGAEAVLAERNRIGDISGILSGGLPPEIELISPAQATVTGEYLLQFKIKEMGGGRGRVVYRIDGAEITGRAIDIAGTGGDTINRYIPVGNGGHTLAITAYSANGKIEGQPKTVRITRSLPAQGSSLYLIAAGISHYSDNSLSEGVKFAAADADMIAATFKGQEGKGLYSRVNAVPLIDRQATIKNIQDAVAQAAKTVQPGDTFVLYLAGHGMAVEGEYYFIPWEAEYPNQKDLLAKSLNREAIQAMLKQIPTNKSALILDTCGAGGYLESRATASEKAAIEKVALMSGRAVLAASYSGQMAMDGYQNHGVFTYALLDGLRQAEVNSQGEILITRLAEFVQSQVPRLTEQKWGVRQLPLSRIDGEPFPIARKAAN
ncbi:MAG TPA: caspase family protein [Bryobacteraceae bacterium]|nr:caspase family protein [Bryobacteraceae bacterium]